MNIHEVEKHLKQVTSVLNEMKMRNRNEFPVGVELDDYEDPESKFKRDRYEKILASLEGVLSEIQWIQKPIVHEGYLQKNESDRYEISGTYRELTSGSGVEYYDEEVKTWIKSYVEHHNDYYIVANGKDKSIDGLLVRTRS
ncbi:DUF5348 domain-containing protein [Priestia koreensis]|uniref:DUF5348 domain-containing protein n=1 Tax=Priestia koreensis TaxID=284581 RepID=UPI00203F5E02|nr:DUF5348 domain-containing protein [Priestia koreensis]MCM3006816.1 DUF5348 domain-containing protein [Priestia koreensis]